MPRLVCVLCIGNKPNRFVTKEGLETHIRRSHLDRPLPWVCTLCPREKDRFALQDQLVDHYQQDHGVNEYEVGSCSESAVRGETQGANLILSTFS